MSRIIKQPYRAVSCCTLYQLRQILSGIALLILSDFLRRAGRDDRAAAVAAFGTEVDDMVDRLDDVEVMFDDDDRIAAVDKAVEDGEQTADVFEVEAGRRLVKDI